MKTILKLCFLFSLFFQYQLAGQSKYEKPVRELVSLFSKKQIDALGENHGKLLDSEFRIALVHDANFQKAVDVIVVEFANPLYQHIIDDYTSGKDVSYNDLVKIWRNTTQVSGVWDSPVYEDFFRAVRNVNKNLSDEKKLRIIAADPPIDWSKVNSFDDFKPFTNRGSYPIGVIEKEVYAKNKKALLIFGLSHVMSIGRGFTDELKKQHPNTLSVVFPPLTNDQQKTFLKRLSKEKEFGLLNLSNTPYNKIKFNDLHKFKNYPRVPIHEAADYLLFFNYSDNPTIYSPEETVEDKSYQTERRRRFKVLADR